MARDQRSSRSAGNVNWGICTNTSGYEKDGEQHKCSKCMNKEKQAIRTSKDFVCEECGEPLTKCPPPKKPLPLPLIIGAAVVVIGGGVGAFFGLRGGDEEIVMEPVTDSVVTAPAATETVPANTVQVEPVQEEPVAEVAKPAAAPKPATSNGANLGWGSYSGPMQGGKPHGAGGTIKVKQHYNIDLKDGRGSTLEVNPGETIENTKFENGRLRSGELHRSNGERKWFNC